MKIGTAIIVHTLIVLIAPQLLSLALILPVSEIQARSLSVSQQPAARKEISRKQAIEIARKQVSFQPKSIKAIKTTADKRAVWRVTFRGEAIGPARPMGEITIIDVDRLNGEIVSISKS